MLNQLTISGLQKRLVAREISAREAVHVCLDQIKRVDGNVKAFLSYDEADALSQAEAVDRLIAGGATTSQYPLLGAPTISIGTIRGGSKTNIIPDLCEASVDMRFVPSQFTPGFAEELSERLRAICPDIELKFQPAPPLDTR